MKKTTISLRNNCADTDCVLTATGSTTKNEDERHDHEHNDGAKLENCDPELLFCISKNTKDVDEYDGQEHQSDPRASIFGIKAPVIDRQSSNKDFQR